MTDRELIEQTAVEIFDEENDGDSWDELAGGEQDFYRAMAVDEIYGIPEYPEHNR